MKIHSLVLILLATAFLSAPAVLAMPPHPDLTARITRGEQAVPYFLSHERQLRARGVEQPSPRGQRTPLDENVNILAILATFSDQPQSTPAVFFDSLLYGTRVGTFRNYYSEVSYGSITIVTVNLPSAHGWNSAPHPYSYYVDGQNGFGQYPQNAQGLTVDLVNLVDPFVDFSNYDNDGDGEVDGLFIIHTGPGAEYTGDDNDIWSHMWSIPWTQVDGVSVTRYSMEPEYWMTSGDMTCGVYAHEAGHAMFALPDFYDYDYDSNGLGDWSLMAGGSWNGRNGNSPAHPDAWCRIQMGFVAPIVVENNVTNFQIPGVEFRPFILQLWTNGEADQEYFLVENRRQVGYDAMLPSEGLLIYHVDNWQHGNDSQWYPGHTDQGHYQVALEQADGLWQLERRASSGDQGDPFPGDGNYRTFSTGSTPGSRDYNNAITGVAVRNISFSADTMSADISVTGGPGAFAFVQMPDTTASTLRPVLMPVSVENLVPGVVTAFQFTIDFDPSIVTCAAPWYDRTGTILPPDWTITQTHADDSLRITCSGTTALSVAEGLLIKLPLSVVATAEDGQISLVNFRSFRFNQGSPGVDVGDGSITVATPRLTIQPSVMNFPDTRFQRSTFRAFVVRNMGTAPLTVDSVVAHAPFAVTTHLPVVLDPTSWVAIRVTFAPPLAQFYSDSLMVYTNAVEGSQVVQVTGRGVPPTISTNPGFLDFDSVAIGSELNRWLSVEDTSAYELIVSDVRMAIGAQFDITPPPSCPDTIPAHGFVNYNIRFRPVSGLCRDTVIVVSDAGAPVRIPVEGTGAEVSTGNVDAPEIPLEFSFAPAYPNPFNATTTFTFGVPREAELSIRVFDVLGRNLGTLLSERVQPGYHTVQWACPDCGSGVYLFVLSAEGLNFVQKATLLK